MFATFEPGLRLDAAANGVPMGGTVAHRNGPVTIDVDIDAGPAWYGKPLVIQVIRPGRRAPTLTESSDVTVPAPEQPTIRIVVDVDIDDGDWLFLRITDPERPADPRATPEYASAGGAVAYTSPFFLTPA